MRYFIDSPFERLMMQRPQQGWEETPPSLPRVSRRYGCSYYGSGCAGTCYRDLIITKKEKKPER